MCKKTQFKYCPSTIDPCMVEFIKNLNFCFRKSIKIVACCCGHKKYPMTVVVNNGGRICDLISGKEIPRKRNFYKKDKQGYYYIPETVRKSLEEVQKR